MKEILYKEARKAGEGECWNNGILEWWKNELTEDKEARKVGKGECWNNGIMEYWNNGEWKKLGTPSGEERINTHKPGIYHGGRESTNPERPDRGDREMGRWGGGNSTQGSDGERTTGQETLVLRGESFRGYPFVSFR